MKQNGWLLVLIFCEALALGLFVRARFYGAPPDGGAAPFYRRVPQLAGRTEAGARARLVWPERRRTDSRLVWVSLVSPRRATGLDYLACAQEVTQEHGIRHIVLLEEARPRDLLEQLAAEAGPEAEVLLVRPEVLQRQFPIGLTPSLFIVDETGQVIRRYPSVGTGDKAVLTRRMREIVDLRAPPSAAESRQESMRSSMH